MIDIDNWMRELEEEEDIEIKNNEEYQTKLFEEYPAPRWQVRYQH